MAERRMFSKSVTDGDNFIELSSSAQALYFHLNQGADDDGFTNQVQNAMFKAHATIDDLKVLLAKEFLIRFESGVVVIRHWRVHNAIRKDRYSPTNFKSELAQLGISEDKSYNLSGCQMVAERLPNGCQMVATGKDRLDKDSIDKVSIKETSKEKVSLRFVKPSVEEIQEYCCERQNGINAQEFWDFYESKGWLIGKAHMKDWRACVRTWERKRKENAPVQPDTPKYSDYSAKSAFEQALERSYNEEFEN